MSFKKALFVFLSLAIVGGVLTGCGDNSGGGGSSEKAAPPLDKERVAADEAKGIKFSADKRTLVKYNRDLPDKEYIIPSGVTTIGKGAFSRCFKLTSVTDIGEGAFRNCPCEASVKKQFPNYR